MKVIEISTGVFRTYGTIPKFWRGTIDGVTRNFERPDLQDPSIQHALGFRDLIYPPYNSMTQKLGGPKWLDDIVGGDITLQVIDLPEEEVKAKLKNQIKFEEAQIIQKEIKEKTIAELQTKEGSEALASKLAYPLWEDVTKCDLNKKYTYIESDNTISLYRCLISHTVDGTLPPPTSPTYFELVTESIIPWEPGINAMKDRLYSFNGKNYRCLEDHLTVAGQDPTKAKQYWVEEKL